MKVLDKNKFKPPVIIIGGRLIALSIVRALAKNRIRCYVIDENDSIVHYSRYCIGIKNQQKQDSDKWLEWLLENGKNLHESPVIIAACDYGLKLVIENRKILEKHFILQEGNDEVTLAMLDKFKTYELAKNLNIPCPRTININNIEELKLISENIEYPCLLKPRVSHKFSYRFQGKKLFEVKNKKELFEYYGLTQKYNLMMTVTELIPLGSKGYDGYYTYLDENGNPMFHFTKIRLRQRPNLSGLGTYNVTNWNQEVMELGLKFLKGIGLRGIGTLEFIRDARDGKLKLLECNPRFTGTTELVHKSGLNWALFVYNRLTGLPLPPMNYYKKNVYIIKPLEDYLAFKELHKNKKISFWQWIRSILHLQHFFIFKFSDPKPFLVNCYFFWKRQLKKFAQRFHLLNPKTIYGGKLQTKI